MDPGIFAQTVFGGFANGTLYAFIGLGFAFISRSTGIINFAQGDLAILGVFIGAALIHAGLSPVVALPVAVLACGAISALFFFIAILPARRASMSQLVIITVGFSIIIRGAIIIAWGTDPVSLPPFVGNRPLDVLGVSILPQELCLMAALLIASLIIAVFFARTVLGLALRAGASNRLGATYMGIDHKWLGFYAFLISGLLAGLGGIMWAPISFAQVDVGAALGIKGFTAAVLGGLATQFGPLVGGLVLGVAEAFITGYLSSGYQEAITFSLLLLVLALRPHGLLSTGRQIVDEIVEAATNRARSLAFDRSTVLKLAAWFVVVIVLNLLLPNTLRTTAIFAGIQAIVVMGLVLLTGYTGQLSLGQGTFMMIGAYASGYLTTIHGWPPIAALVAGALLASVAALALGKLIFRLSGYYLAMASLCVLLIALNFARELTPITGGPNGMAGIPPFSVFNVKFITDFSFYFLMTAICGGMLVFCVSLTRSQFGRALLAVRSNEAAARASGVNVALLKMKIFALSAAMASIAGSLYVHYLGIANPAPFGLDSTITQLTALVLGGVLALWGSFIGAMLVTVLPIILVVVGGDTSSQAAAGWQYLLFGVLLTAVVVFQTGEFRSVDKVRAVFGRRAAEKITPAPSEP